MFVSVQIFNPLDFVLQGSECFVSVSLLKTFWVCFFHWWKCEFVVSHLFFSLKQSEYVFGKRIWEFCIIYFKFLCVIFPDFSNMGIRTTTSFWNSLLTTSQTWYTKPFFLIFRWCKRKLRRVIRLAGYPNLFMKVAFFLARSGFCGDLGTGC